VIEIGSLSAQLLNVPATNTQVKGAFETHRLLTLAQFFEDKRTVCLWTVPRNPDLLPDIHTGLIVVFQLLLCVQMKSSLQFALNPTGLESNLRAGRVPVPPIAERRSPDDYGVGADHLAARIRERTKKGGWTQHLSGRVAVSCIISARCNRLPELTVLTGCSFAKGKCVGIWKLHREKSLPNRGNDLETPAPAYYLHALCPVTIRRQGREKRSASLNVTFHSSSIGTQR